MRAALGLLAFGTFLLILRGVLSGVVPAAMTPDLALLVVVGLGLSLPGALGLALVAAFGVLTDVLAGALLGHHSLLFLFFFAVTRIAGAQLDLRRGVPVLVVVAGLSIVNGLATVALSRLFGIDAPWPAFGRVVGQAGFDALFAPLVIPAMAGIVRMLSEEDRRAVELAPRRREA